MSESCVGGSSGEDKEGAETRSFPEANNNTNNSTNNLVKNQFNKFADYFVICGLDLDLGLEPEISGNSMAQCVLTLISVLLIRRVLVSLCVCLAIYLCKCSIIAKMV